MIRFLTFLVSLAYVSWAEASLSLYLEDLKPVLQERCYACHGALKQEAGLRVDTAAFLLKGSKHGVIIDLDSVAASPLLQRLRHEDMQERMPPEGMALDQATIAAMEQWIAAGAPRPENENEEADPRKHWAFQRIERPNLPQGRFSNPIDAILDARHQALGLRPQPQAERSTLLRRLYLNLIGLSPSLEQLTDERPWNVIVDELLGSPHHGERWGRHWMDIWRYSDWYGLGKQLRYSQRHLWRWRDWIIDSINADKGYDRMIVEMLAGDECAPEDPDTVRATGFLARNYYLFNRTTWLDTTIEHTGKAFLGLTMNCAKCHDHKYDPISHQDYYRFRAIFEPHHVRLDPVPGTLDFDQDGLPRVYDDQLEVITYLHRRGDPKSPDETRGIEPGVPAMLSAFAPEIASVSLTYRAHTPGARTFVQQAHLQEAEFGLAKAQEAHAKNETEATELEVEWKNAILKSVRAVIAADRARVESMPDAEDLAVKAAQAQTKADLAKGRLELCQAGGHHAKRKGARQKMDKAKERLAEVALGRSDYLSLRASRKALETPEHKFEDYDMVYPGKSTGRRLALARWITHRDNPLTARVAVNHVWARHFGVPLVDSMFDFGRRTPKPELGELLDFLAIELIDSDWSLRHLHRLIVTSAAYRRSSSTLNADATSMRRDPTNTFYWKSPTRRMESDLVRDNILHFAEVIDLTVGGPSIDPKKAGRRRSLYFLQSRDHKDQFLSMFDHADHLRCYRRKESIVPQQALALSNSKLSIEMAEKVANRLMELEDKPFVEQIFQIILCRPPGEEEGTACETFIHEFPRGSFGDRRRRVRARLVHALFNHNDFVTIR